nr:hypothetical protein [Lachnospiraceae bacterium]
MEKVNQTEANADNLNSLEKEQTETNADNRNSQDKKDKKKCKIEKQKNPNPIFVSNKFYAVLYVVVPILLNVFLESC